MTKRILITGATAGIGLNTAQQLALSTKTQDVELLLANRNPEKAARVKETLANITDNPIRLFTVDFNDLASVRACAEDIASQCDSIDVLINNAGIFSPHEATTLNGFEKHIGVNFLAPVLLTEKLLPTLKKATQGRVIHVASAAHVAARKGIQFDDFKGWADYNPIKAYGHSKLANLLYSKALATRLASQPDTTHITSNALHPGGAASSIYRDMNWVLRKVMGLVSISTQGAAERIEGMALSPTWERKTGKYTSVQTPAWQTKFAKDNALAEQLMQHTHALLTDYLA